MGKKGDDYTAGPDSMFEGSERSEGSTSSASGTEGSSGHGAGGEMEKETKVMLLSRLAVGTILMITAVAAGVTTFLVTSREQLRDFQVQVRTTGVCNVVVSVCHYLLWRSFIGRLPCILYSSMK